MSAQPVTDTRDDRYMAILTTLSRYGVRLDPERMSALVSDLLQIARRSPSAVPDWKPGRETAPVRRKNPAPGVRVCKRCGEAKPLDDFGTYERRGRRHPRANCRECLNDYQRNRYITARKMEGALNAARLEFVADDEVAGLRCLDCHAEIVVGDEVVAETGLRHLACRGAA